MSTGNAIVVKYWVSTDHLPFDDLKGIEEFRDELASAYVSVVSGEQQEPVESHICWSN